MILVEIYLTYLGLFFEHDSILPHESHNKDIADNSYGQDEKQNNTRNH